MSGEGKPSFAGKYKFVKNERFDDYLSANGVNWMIRKMIGSSSPTMTIDQTENNFVIKLASLTNTKETKFTVGEEFDETQPNGDIFKVKPDWDGDKIVMSYTPMGKGKPQKVTRELNGNEFVVTMEVDGVVAKRFFNKE